MGKLRIEKRWTGGKSLGGRDCLFLEEVVGAQQRAWGGRESPARVHCVVRGVRRGRFSGSRPQGRGSGGTQEEDEHGRSSVLTANLKVKVIPF